MNELSPQENRMADARVRRHFCLLLAEIGSLTRVMGGALLRHLVDRTGGCDQAREGNTDRSMHRHCSHILLAGHPLPLANE
jgi:hypothetical protein